MTKTKDMQKTTIRIDKIDLIKKHYLKQGIPSLRLYINHLISEDIKKTGEEQTIKEYFEKESQ